MRWVEGTDLVEWANRVDSRTLLPDLVRRLILATVSPLHKVEFRTGEGVQLPGYDGYVETPAGTEKVPLGISCWELGTSGDPRTKAQEDYASRTDDSLGVDKSAACFVFVTPRRWSTKNDWIQQKLGDARWQDVRAYDADDLDTWLLRAPAVGAWLARQIGKYPANVSSIDDFWTEYSATTNPRLTDHILLAGRRAEQDRVVAWLRDPPSLLQIQADSATEAFGFISATVSQLPADEQAVVRSRMLLTRDAETLRAVSMTRAGITILYEGTDRTPAAAAVQWGHHVMIPTQRGRVPQTNEIALPRASRDAFAAALKQSGLNEQEAFKIAGEVGRSVTAVQRRFAVVQPPVPSWAQPPLVHDLIGMLFAGAWDERRDADKAIVAELTGKPYDGIGEQALAWTQGGDPPLRRAGTVFAISALRDAWEQVASHVTRGQLARFKAVVERVLAEDDPRLTLPPDERWLAGTRGQEPAHSAELREGLARSLVMLSILGANGVISHRAQNVAPAVVGNLLAAGSPWQRWYSLADVLRILSESAPDEFLAGLDSQLTRDAPDIMQLFTEEGGGFSPSSKHPFLLWALELLAWDPRHLGSITLILGKLARLDTGGHSQNRPINSLRGIFLLWHPNTTATLAERMQALDLLVEREPAVAWDLLVKLQPKPHDVGTSTARPQWREAVTPPPVTLAEHVTGVKLVIDRVLRLAGTNAQRLTILVKECASWSPESREQLVTQLATLTDTATPEERTLVWSTLRKFIYHHRAYPRAEWALPEALLAPFVHLLDQMRPSDLITQHGWLFDDWFPELGEAKGTDFAAIEARVTQGRHVAIAGIHGAEGTAGLLRLARSVKFPGLVGRDAAAILQDEATQRELLLVTLASGNTSERFIGQSFVTAAHKLYGEEWVDRMLATSLTDDPIRTGTFFLGLPFDSRTWDRAAGFQQDVNSRYWREANVWLPQDTSLAVLTTAVDRLVEAGRAVDALELVSSHLDIVSGEMLVRVLEGVREALIRDASLPIGHFSFALEEVFARLRGTDVSSGIIARLEWFFLPLISHGRHTPRLALHDQLSSDPALFAEVITGVYRADGAQPDEAPSEDASARARVGYELLSSWRSVPGTLPDGTLDAARLNEWVAQARERCTVGERLAVGDIHIGQVCSFAPTDQDGHHPHQAIRSLIERLASPHFDEGITNGLFNARGAYSKAFNEGGVKEREIAAGYRRNADACAISSPRTARILRKLAESYDGLAEHEDHQAQQRDLD